MFPVTPSMDEQFSGLRERRPRARSDGVVAVGLRPAPSRRVNSSTSDRQAGGARRGRPGASTSAGGIRLRGDDEGRAGREDQNETRDGMVAKHARRVVRRNERDGRVARFAFGVLQLFRKNSEKNQPSFLLRRLPPRAVQLHDLLEDHLDAHEHQRHAVPGRRTRPRSAAVNLRRVQLWDARPHRRRNAASSSAVDSPNTAPCLMLNRSCHWLGVVTDSETMFSRYPSPLL